MGDIVLKSGIKSQRFTNELGKSIELKINLGDTDIYAAWVKKAKELEDLPKDMSDLEAVQKMKPIAQSLISTMFGRRSLRKIERFCRNNIFAEMKIIEVFTGLIEAGIKENVSK